MLIYSFIISQSSRKAFKHWEAAKFTVMNTIFPEFQCLHESSFLSLETNNAAFPYSNRQIHVVHFQEKMPI